MYSRTLRLPARGSCLLLGPRQTGKSTLVRASVPHGAFTVDLLHHETWLRYTKDPSQFRADATTRIERGAPMVVVDEIQKIPALLDEVHSLIESHRARFVLTGSSARKLRRGGANLLAGRAVVRHLHPLTKSELGSAFDLDRALRFGTLPVVASSPDDDARDLLEAYAATYLREEIQAEAIVRNLGGFGRFLEIVASQSGELLNVSALARDAGLATRTVQQYVEVLEDTLMGVRLEPWRKGVRARMVGHPRLYFFDLGVRNAITRTLTASPDPSARGRLFEQWVILETRRALDYARTEARAFFWRTNVGAEVDLVLEKHGTLRVAAEIKAKKRVVAADVPGLRSFGEAEPTVPRVVICETPTAYSLGDIQVLPYAEFFDKLNDWL